MDIGKTDPNHPNLSVGNPRVQFVYRPHLAPGKLIRARFNVDGEELALIVRLEMEADLLVKSIATPGEFFFTVANVRSMP